MLDPIVVLTQSQLSQAIVMFVVGCCSKIAEAEAAVFVVGWCNFRG